MANLLTGLRLLLALPVAAAIAVEGLLPAPMLAAMILAAIATDYLDGRIARASGTVSDGGQLFDHATDFIFVGGGLTGAAVAGLAPWQLPVLVTAAFTQYVLDSRWLHRRKSLRMSFLGRWNGICYFVPLVLIAAARLLEISDLQPILYRAAFLVCIVLILSTVASIVDRALAPPAAD